MVSPEKWEKKEIYLLWEKVYSYQVMGSGQATPRFVVVPLLSHVWLFANPWTAACQTSLSLSPRVCSNSCPASVMPSNYLFLYHQLLLLFSIFPSIRVFSNESALHIRWPRYWSFSFSISPLNEYSGLGDIYTSFYPTAFGISHVTWILCTYVTKFTFL